MKNLIILTLLLFLVVACKTETVEEVVPVETTPAVEEIIEEVTE